MARNLTDLLMIAPDPAVEMVQEAIRAVARGDWRSAARQMSLAAETSAEADTWFSLAGEAADDLWSKA